MSKTNKNAVFISAKKKESLSEFKKLPLKKLKNTVKKIPLYKSYLLIN